jgi:hypothetical protein
MNCASLHATLATSRKSLLLCASVEARKHATGPRNSGRTHAYNDESTVASGT